MIDRWILVPYTHVSKPQLPLCCATANPPAVPLRSARLCTFYSSLPSASAFRIEAEPPPPPVHQWRKSPEICPPTSPHATLCILTFVG